MFEPDADGSKRGLGKMAIYMASMIGILVFINSGCPTTLRDGAIARPA
jgi:hypothetical protein